MRNLYTHPRRLPLIAPSILSADFANMGQECRQVLDAGADSLHVDVMDGHFVPNLTMGPDMCRALRRAIPDVFIDVHLMVADPGGFIEPFVEAGANHITFHIEVTAPENVAGLAARIREAGATAGLALNPPTPVDAVLPHVDSLDLILVMSVNPGFSGRAFIPAVLEKARDLEPLVSSLQRIQIDGGIKPSNVQSVRESGVDLIVAASAVFGVPPVKRAEVIGVLRGTQALP